MGKKHTPGPWFVTGAQMRDGSREIAHPPPSGRGAPEPVAYAADHNSYERDAEVDAVANLIAAAPDLLDACRALLDLGRFVRGSAYVRVAYETEQDKAQSMALAAIRKAVGE
jgi:hypothetical protein